MGQLITLIGTYFLAGYITLLVLTLNIQMNSSIYQYQQDSFSSSSAIGISQTMEFDMYKAGYGTSGNSLIQADSTAVKFLSDLDNNGTIDTVSYYMGTSVALSSTANPNDFSVFRKQNSGTANTVAFLTSVKFTYSDSTGAAINYASLTTQANRNKVDYITSYVRCERPDSSSNAYSPVEWQLKIRPKNL